MKFIQNVMCGGLAVLLIIISGTAWAQSQRKLKVGLSWIHQAQFTGEYYADQNGLYRAKGLDVELIPATYSSDPLNEFLEGKTDIVIAQPDLLILAREKGAKIKAVAATYRIHPMVLTTLPESGIKRPRDLKGKTIGVAYSEEMILRALLKKRGISPDDVKIINPRKYDLKGLESGKYDVQAAWITDEIQTAREKGMKVRLMLPADYGVFFYADLIAVREEMLQKEPQVIENFLRATLEGWQQAARDTEKHSKLTLRYNKKLTASHEKMVLESSMPLIHTGENHIGWMKPEVWEATYQTMIRQNIAQGNAKSSDMYTLRFLQEIYP